MGTTMTDLRGSQSPATADSHAIDAMAVLRSRSDQLDAAFDRTTQALVDHAAARSYLKQWTLNRRVGESYVVVAASHSPGGLRSGDTLPWADTICAQMVAGRGPRAAGDLVGTVYEPAMRHGVRAYLGVPLLDEVGRVMGTLSGTDDRERPDLQDMLPLTEVVGALASHALAGQRLVDEYARALGNATSAAETDALTGLGNRRAWIRTLQEEQRRMDHHNTQAGIIVVDVDGLKTVNDSKGHSSGDELLCRTAEAILQVVRTPDFAARIGGDEFGIIIGNVTLGELDVVAGQLRSMLDRMDATASIGAALATHMSLTDAVVAADEAMYAVKALTRHDDRMRTWSYVRP